MEQSGGRSMIIHIERSGGIAGIPFTKTIDSHTLPESKKEKLQTLITETDFFHLSSEISTSSERDRFQYTITIEYQSRKHTVIFDEKTLPKSLQTLINTLH